MLPHHKDWAVKDISTLGLAVETQAIRAAADKAERVSVSRLKHGVAANMLAAANMAAAAVGNFCQMPLDQRKVGERPARQRSEQKPDEAARQRS